MAENIAQTVQKAIQDILAPDVRELKVQVADLQKQMDLRFAEVQRQFADMQRQMNLRFEAQSQKADLQFSAIMAAISESRAHAELTSFQRISSIRRVAALEAQRQ